MFCQNEKRAALTEYVGRSTSASFGLKNVCNLVCFQVKSDITFQRSKLVQPEQLNVIMEFFSNDVAIPGK